MKKKLNKIIIIGLAIVMVTFIFYKKITDNNPYNDFKNISINESLNQKIRAIICIITWKIVTIVI